MYTAGMRFCCKRKTEADMDSQQAGFWESCMGRSMVIKMKKPEMILFDYGQTLIDEERFDGVRGTAQVMKYAVKNPHSLTPEQVQAQAQEINRELGRFDPAGRHLVTVEVHNHPFNAYLYESQGIGLSLSYEQAEEVFWNGAAPGKPTPGIEGFLAFLKKEGIRTGVISNISFSGKALKNRIDRMLPSHCFEFILASSEYVFRKPNPRIFRLALEKAQLSPEQVWYVGDQYECDIVGAAGAGILPVWYTACIQEGQGLERGGQKGFQVKSWQELEQALTMEPEGQAL